MFERDSACICTHRHVEPLLQNTHLALQGLPDTLTCLLYVNIVERFVLLTPSPQEIDPFLHLKRLFYSIVLCQNAVFSLIAPWAGSSIPAQIHKGVKWETT